MRPNRRVPRPLYVSALCSGVFAVCATNAAAQIPDTFTNLQVLPADISRAELIGTMRGFAGALGVRCSYCHMVSDLLNQPDDDFSSDDKATKRKARVMLGMVRRINEEILPRLPERTSPNVQVECRTCHGGIPRPVPIDEEIEHTIADRGIDAAVERYRELREQYYGSRSYDFSFAPLNELAEGLLAGEKTVEAVRVLELNAEYNPASLPTLLLLGQAHERNGDNEAAVRAYRALLELDPSTRFFEFYAGRARARIEAIGEAPG